MFSPIFPGLTFPLWSLVCVFAAALAMSAAVALQVLLRRPSWSRWLNPLGRAVMPAIGMLLAVDAIDSIADGMGRTGHFVTVTVSVAAVFALSRICAFVSRSPGGRLSKLLGQVVMLGAYITAAWWSGQRFYREAFMLSDLGLLQQTPGIMRDATDASAVTDAGRSVQLFRWDVDDDSFEYFSALSNQRLEMLQNKIIQRAAPDYRYNCHGWVFTGGEYLLRGHQVEQILQDNGYTVTDKPRPNDLVIYRSTDGTIVHTGLVRSVLEDGTVLEESKWGLDGRYLHRPEDTPYSKVFAYYRGARPDHRIVIKKTEPSPLVSRGESVLRHRG